MLDNISTAQAYEGKSPFPGTRSLCLYQEAAEEYAEQPVKVLGHHAFCSAETEATRKSSERSRTQWGRRKTTGIRVTRGRRPQLAWLTTAFLDERSHKAWYIGRRGGSSSFRSFMHMYAPYWRFTSGSRGNDHRPKKSYQCSSEYAIGIRCHLIDD